MSEHGKSKIDTERIEKAVVEILSAVGEDAAEPARLVHQHHRTGSPTRQAAIDEYLANRAFVVCKSTAR